jgi:hypothetical protein
MNFWSLNGGWRKGNVGCCERDKGMHGVCMNAKRMDMGCGDQVWGTQDEENRNGSSLETKRWNSYERNMKVYIAEKGKAELSEKEWLCQ